MSEGNVAPVRRRVFPETFKRVETSGLTYKAVADESGLHETVRRRWVRKYGSSGLPVQELVPALGVGALAVAVFPWAPGLDVKGLHAQSAEPLPNRSGDELWSVIGTNVLGRTVAEEKLGELFEDMLGVQLPLDTDRKAFPCALIDNAEHPVHSAVVSTVLNKVVAPDVVRTLGPESHARSVIQT